MEGYMKNNLYCYYRISDKGNPLGRGEGIEGTFLETINRKKCFNNFLNAFGTENLIVICDNTTRETTAFITEKNPRKIFVTSFGNTVSFNFVVNMAIKNHSEKDIIYFVEDDYLHTEDAKKYILEGIEIGDYVSLYDSLDKYQGTNNPLISDGGENTKVILGQSSHFKYTNATTCTFASKVETLKKDIDIINKYSNSAFPHPMDFLMFRELITQRKRKLICPIPGKSSHVGLELSPFVDWKEIIKGLGE